MAHVKFELKRCKLESVSERVKVDETKYAVIRVSYSANTRPCEATMLCFASSIYNTLSIRIGDCFCFKGTVVFRSGNTFLAIEEAFDEYGNSVFYEHSDTDLETTE